MQIEVGQIIEGKVTGITNFGVFVDLGEGKSGLVHVSEIAQTYVSDVKEFVKENASEADVNPVLSLASAT